MESTFAIQLNGIVQGVGFRPFVYRSAKTFGITGFVRNDKDGVFIEASGKNVEAFYHHILENAPQQAKIISHSFQKTETKNYPDFRIIESEAKQNNKQLFITPDFAMCENCRKELHDENNRRYHYPFITCTDCGARYSILKKLPFDRENTSMQMFHQCDECLQEYNDASDIRFYSQTNSCKKCGITLSFYNNKNELLSQDVEEILQQINVALQSGKIIAAKGIGGFLLLCDANNEQAVKTLRARKHRPTKPFAVMYPNLQQIENDYEVSEVEKEMLQSAAAPIVLLQPKSPLLGGFRGAAPKLNRVGVFLPYAPLLELILSKFNKPVIATSANISGDSIVYDNEKALQDLPQLADFILLNNRDITMPQDDSVIQFSSKTKTKIILRNGRGFAPIHFLNCQTHKTIFASGALLKSSFALAQNDSIYVSQYLGSTDEYDTQQTYKKVAENFLNLTSAKIETIVCDKHPDYFSTQFAKQKSEEQNISLQQIQHHKAHFAAVLAENNLLENNEKMLGVVWDGTGLGDDEQIWGGDFFSYQNKKIERVCHFEYVPNLLGDKMAKEPRLSALSFCKGMADDILKEKFTGQEWNYFQKILNNKYEIVTSSCGRLFDAVAALLNLCDKQSYEGEAALYLENLATENWKKFSNFMEDYDVHFDEEKISVQTILKQIISDIKCGENKGKIALKFHLSLVEMIETVARKNEFKKIAFSGGVFQNSLLVDLIKIKLEKKYQLFFHQKLSPNDENISFGQVIFPLIAQIDTE
ncbi:carbamoyltransferase HypF [Arachidicoccus ginsenosidimutans]|uniref:carbamoyltransferase HypF n=1 Tax=Arachidicoccus sp. BS20 TaxID=1850526 RepID=UPI0007F15C78|nr:carbamoyltransferase HypF [Arachidicoccus sp. BS20]ANI87883.1 carbamoyltransferase HypF [Arachidicoccus sp. BS20]